jgi:hypothetical protein
MVWRTPDRVAHDAIAIPGQRENKPRSGSIPFIRTESRISAPDRSAAATCPGYEPGASSSMSMANKSFTIATALRTVIYGIDGAEDSKTCPNFNDLTIDDNSAPLAPGSRVAEPTLQYVIYGIYAHRPKLYYFISMA